jgi:outer membrane protein OmpA-like peptidoglycan-associated protein
VSRAVIRALGVTIALAAASAVSADLASAKRFYDQAKAEKDPAAQAKLLEKSIAAEPTFEAHLALGDARLASKRYAEARASLKGALDLAGTAKARARALYVIAETFLAEGQRRDAIALLRQSVQQHAYPNVLERLKELELKSMDKPVGADEIAGALTSSATRAFSVAAASSIDLRIGFALDSADLDGAGRNQARELGRALQTASLADKSFELVGHTDVQGDEAYNDKLSQRRADAVRGFLMREFKIPESRLTAVGRGERELLYPGTAESDHALNRRVELRVQ